MGLFFNNQDIANAGVTEKAVLYSRSRFSWELSEIGAVKPDRARLLRGAQPPLGGCVLKQSNRRQRGQHHNQPPLGGCVLKQFALGAKVKALQAAAFRRLCVETDETPLLSAQIEPAAFRRLCVETAILFKILLIPTQPPLGGCVLKRQTTAYRPHHRHQPPLGGCVLKPKRSA